MPTIEDVIQDISAACGEQVLRSWRITGQGFRTVSGSNVEDPLLEARDAAQELAPGTYQLWVTDGTKQTFSGQGGWHAIRKFEVSAQSEGVFKDERMSALAQELKSARAQCVSQQHQIERLTQVLTETTAAHAKALAHTGDGIAKLLSSNTNGLTGLADAHVELLGQSKAILVASAEDARAEALARQKDGPWQKLWEGLVPELGEYVKEALPLVFQQALPMAVQAGKLLLSLKGG